MIFSRKGKTENSITINPVSRELLIQALESWTTEGVCITIKAENEKESTLEILPSNLPLDKE